MTPKSTTAGTDSADGQSHPSPDVLSPRHRSGQTTPTAPWKPGGPTPQLASASCLCFSRSARSASCMRFSSSSTPARSPSIAARRRWRSASRSLTATSRRALMALSSAAISSLMRAISSPASLPVNTLLTRAHTFLKKPLKRFHAFCKTPMKFVQAVPRKLTVSTQATWMPAQALLRKRARPQTAR